MISGKEFLAMHEGARTREVGELRDILDVEIRGDTPARRFESFLDQIGDPYHFRVGRTAVRVRFNESGKTLGDSLKTYFLGLKR